MPLPILSIAFAVLIQPCDSVARRTPVRTVVDTLRLVHEFAHDVTALTLPVFAPAVFDFLTRTHFTPATVAGCPVKQIVQEPFQFRPSPPSLRVIP